MKRSLDGESYIREITGNRIASGLSDGYNGDEKIPQKMYEVRMILYKYMPLERKGFWTDYTLRFTQPSAFNDPFDCLPSYSFIPEQLMPEYSGFGELAALFYGMEKDSARFNDDTAIFCMSEVWDSVLMWAHYADSHKGFAVGFDVSHPFFDFEKPYGTRKVKYCKSRPKSTEIDIKDELYYKLDVWSYEQEWRLCREVYKADQTINDSIFLFRLPRESVKSVRFGICMPEHEKMEIYKKVSGTGIQCYQVMRNYQTYALHSVEFEDFLSLQRRHYILQKEFEQADTPPKPPDQAFKTADAVRDSLERCAEILNRIMGQTYQKFGGRINESNIKEYSRTIGIYKNDLEAINCLPVRFDLCDRSISREVYENRIKHIQTNFDQCIYQLTGLIDSMNQSAHGLLPNTGEYLTMKIKEKTSGAASAFASSVSWSAKYLEEQEFQKVIAGITFDEDFQKMHADDEGWRTGQKIAKRWYEMKYHALEARNETDLKRYRTTRMEWARAGISDSDMESDEIESYIKNVCQYEQGSVPALREEADPYTGILSADKRRQIRERLFFFDVVQANGGFVSGGYDGKEEDRRRARIKKQLINGGIRESDAREYMRMLPAQL